ncbi:hypothetical protein [Ruminococcus flavefaciens]|uniref:hypothetical protein n=1 Tax=Ruminococcus flavefaciens TaxID=1265 RepID=UPI00046601CF|nr:hypothetical protein [Ruminococcus flavefaciens]
MKKVTTGKEKQATYKAEYSRYKKANDQGFYLEGLVIGYAIIEDRLVAFLHYCGIVSRDKDNLEINKPVYPFIRVLLNKPENSTIKVKDIRVKMDIIQSLLKLDIESAQRIDEETKAIIDKQNEGKKRKTRFINGYMPALQKKMDNLNRDDLLVILSKDLESWRLERNTIIHALLNQKIDGIFKATKELSKQGYDLTRKLDDKLVDPVKKKGTNIRKKFNIQ